MKTYKNIFKAIMVGTLACTTVGCSSSDNEPTQEKEQSVEKNKENKPYALPTEIMSVEDTQKLTEGMVLLKDEIEALPDEATLEEMGYMTTYMTHSVFYNDKGEIYVEMDQLVEKMLDNVNSEEIETGTNASGNKFEEEFLGIQITKINNFIKDQNGTWVKEYVYEGQSYLGSPVVSEKVLSELGE